MAHEVRVLLKIVRDTEKTAYDLLPGGQTIGHFANIYAIDRYTRKVESKKYSARENRKTKRKSAKLYNPYKKSETQKNESSN
jgi:hypothetical protein